MTNPDLTAENAKGAEISAEVKALAIFCLQRQGRCWPGWSAGKVFRYLAFHFLSGTIFTADYTDGTDKKLCGLAVAWLADESEVKAREEERRPQFDWKLPKRGDALVIAEVFGDRKASAVLWQLAKARWPGIRTVFCERILPGNSRGQIADSRLRLIPAVYMDRWLARAMA